jgi:hypothetical protein
VLDVLLVEEVEDVELVLDVLLVEEVEDVELVLDVLLVEEVAFVLSTTISSTDPGIIWEAVGIISAVASVGAGRGVPVPLVVFPAAWA